MSPPASHRDTGLRRLLVRPKFYEWYQRLIGGDALRRSFVRDVVRPRAGDRVLDIGCGAGHVLDLLPDDVAYDGVDPNPRYIDLARRRYAGRPGVRFILGRAEAIPPNPGGPYDIVMANALLHHVDDDGVRSLLRYACDSLKPTGAFCSFENAWHPDQTRIARFIISQDRGRNVRTVDAYRALLAERWPHVDVNVSHDALRIPYTIATLRAYGVPPTAMT